ncbi:MAG: DUF4912 domain-containing protein [Planctomycetota bacterium]|nr:DUF4912 domain-containing protein [Planctomycetota bacterium]
MSPDSLPSLSRKDLEVLARKQGVAGAASLSKPQLLRALQQGKTTPKSKSHSGTVKPASRSKGTSATSNSKKSVAPSPNGRVSKKPPTVVAKPTAAKPTATATQPTKPRTPAPRTTAESGRHGEATAASPVVRHRDLSTGDAGDARGKNLLVASACDPHWIRISWLLSRDSVRRAETRLGPEWHRAIPVLRLFRIHSDDASAGNETFIKDAIIDSDSNTWYLPVPTPGRAFRVHIGYRGSSGTFFAMAKSGICHMPKLNAARLSDPAHFGAFSEHGVMVDGEGAGDDANPARPIGFSTIAHFGPAATRERLTGEFTFKLATELVIHGNTRPGSALTVQGESVELRDDGSFTLRINQPEGRQVLAFTAMDPRGNERRMIVLAMERNTKELERQYFDGGHTEMTGE